MTLVFVALFWSPWEDTLAHPRSQRTVARSDKDGANWYRHMFDNDIYIKQHMNMSIYTIV